MDTLNETVAAAKPDDKDKAPKPERMVQIEVTLQGSPQPTTLELRESDHVLADVRKALGLEPDVLLFERDKDEPLSDPIKGRKAIRLVASHARLITAHVNYDHLTREERVPPSRTVYKLLQWAVSKKGFNLDPVSAAKANLILPGAEEPLPREAVIASYVKPGEKELTVDLTLRDFTNGGA